MNESTMKLPGRRRIAAALRAASERFVQELNVPQAQAPDWDEFEWRAAMTVAVMYGISALLGQRLRWQGPPLWQHFIAEQSHQSVLREQRVRSLLAQLDAAAKAEGIALMALKGSAMLDMGLYAPGVRPQSDIDLLCRPEDEAAAIRVIESIGYVAGDIAWKHTDYSPAGQAEERMFGEHIRNPHKIELHTRIAERLPYREVGIDIRRADVQAGVYGYESEAVLLKHLLLHAAGNVSMCGTRLIQLHDIALLCRRFGPAVMEEVFGDDGPAWWAWPTLALAARCFPGHVDAAALRKAEAACPAWLRWQIEARSFESLTLSDLHIRALPALAWSRSASAAFEYMWRQLVPDQVVQRNRVSLAKHGVVAKGVAWAAQPQWLRVVRWLVARPARVPTMYSIRKACSYDPEAVC